MWLFVWVSEPNVAGAFISLLCGHPRLKQDARWPGWGTADGQDPGLLLFRVRVPLRLQFQKVPFQSVVRFQEDFLFRRNTHLHGGRLYPPHSGQGPNCFPAHGSLPAWADSLIFHGVREWGWLPSQETEPQWASGITKVI